MIPNLFHRCVGRRTVVAAIVVFVVAFAVTPHAWFVGSDVGGIPDGCSGTPCPGAPRDVHFVVSGVTAPLTAVTVSFTLSHTYAGDVHVALIAPTGTTFPIVSRIGATTAGGFGDSSHWNGTYTFTDAATGPNIWTVATDTCPGCDIPGGIYRTTEAGGAGQTNPAPVTNLTAAFAFLSTAQITGVWTLRFQDVSVTDTGNVSAATLTLGAGTTFDVNADGKSDRTLFRPANGVWYTSITGGSAQATAWGTSTDIDVAADFDGDRKMDLAIFRPSSGVWFVLRSTGGVDATTWGVSGDIPMAGDVDGDGKADRVVFRPSQGVWYINKSGGGTGVLAWGVSTDQPLLMDVDGDRKADPTVYRPSTNTWFSALSGGGSAIQTWGIPGDVPVPGDFDGDGKSDIAVYRPNSGEWYVLRSSDNGTTGVSWGVSGDVPISGDWDGDSRADFIVYRPGNGIWYAQFAVGGGAAVAWGAGGDRPIGRIPGS
jgi:subtilisin-like proprotein convertase family protein